MTLDEVVAVSKKKLVEYELRLNVRGRKPYSKSANGPIQQKYEASLSSVHNEDIERMVSSVLEELVNLKDGFVMSEPPDGLLSSPSAGRVVATHNFLNLLFTKEYDPKTDKCILNVRCWYYPAGYR